MDAERGVDMRDDVKCFVDKYVRRFNKLEIPACSLILFGSQARGTATICSDIDIAVVMDGDLSPKQRGALLNLADEIDPRQNVNLFFTKSTALEKPEGTFNTNKYIKEEGIVLWQP